MNNYSKKEILTMLKSIILIFWMSSLIGLASLGTYYLLKQSLRISLSFMETFAVIIPLAIGYLAYSYLILATLGLLVPTLTFIISTLPLVLFITLPETRHQLFREKKISVNSVFHILRKLGSISFKHEFLGFLGLMMIIICLTLLIDPKMHHYTFNKADFYWFDSWRYWRLGRRVAASRQLSEPYVFDFYSHALECFLASIFLPANIVQPTIDVTKFFGIMMYILEIIGVFALVQICLKPRVSPSIAIIGGILAMSFYVSAPIVVYHSLIVVHETLSIPLLFSLLIITAKIETISNKAYQRILVIYISLFWVTSIFTLIIVIITMAIQRVILFFHREKNHRAKTLVRRLEIREWVKTWKIWLIVAFFVVYPLLSIIFSYKAIFYDIEKFLRSSLGTNGGTYTSNNRMLRVIGLFDITNIIVNSVGIIGMGVIIIFGILLPRYWKYLDFRNSTRFTLQFIYWIYYLELAHGLLWSIMPFNLFTEQFRLSLYVTVAGSIIAGVSIGSFLQYAKKRITAPKNNCFRFSLLKNAEKVIVVILLMQMIYGISLSDYVHMWEDERAYHDLIQISNDLPVETGTIFCLEQNLVFMTEGILFPKFEIIYAPFLVLKRNPVDPYTPVELFGERPLVKPYTPVELTRYFQQLRDNNVNLFIVRWATWNTVRQIYEETRLEFLMTAWDYKLDTPQPELWKKSWDDMWEELPGFQKLEYSQLLVVMILIC